VYEEQIMATHVETNKPTPKTLRYLREYPLVGSLPDFRNDRLGLLLRLAREGDVCGMHFGPFPGIFSTNLSTSTAF
jgi:hypothetical protein